MKRSSSPSSSDRRPVAASSLTLSHHDLANQRRNHKRGISNRSMQSARVSWRARLELAMSHQKDIQRRLLDLTFDVD